MNAGRTTSRAVWPLGHVMVAGLLTASFLADFAVAPREASMGDCQRVLYVHVSVAWSGLLGLLVMGASGAAYLARRDLVWDHWAQAAGELAWLSTGLTLVTGSLWARSAWNAWWTWDPRLMSSFVLWAICSGYLLIRAGMDDAHRRARIGSVLAILGVLDVPLVILSTRWLRGIHPVSPQMEPAMRGALVLSVAAFTALFALLLAQRRAQLRLASQLESLEQQLENRRPAARTAACAGSTPS